MVLAGCLVRVVVRSTHFGRVGSFHHVHMPQLHGTAAHERALACRRNVHNLSVIDGDGARHGGRRSARLACVRVRSTGHERALAIAGAAARHRAHHVGHLAARAARCTRPRGGGPGRHRGVATAAASRRGVAARVERVLRDRDGVDCGLNGSSVPRRRHGPPSGRDRSGFWHRGGRRVAQCSRRHRTLVVGCSPRRLGRDHDPRRSHRAARALAHTTVTQARAHRGRCRRGGGRLDHDVLRREHGERHVVRRGRHARAAQLAPGRAHVRRRPERSDDAAADAVARRPSHQGDVLHCRQSARRLSEHRAGARRRRPTRRTTTRITTTNGAGSIPCIPSSSARSRRSRGTVSPALRGTGRRTASALRSLRTSCTTTTCTWCSGTTPPATGPRPMRS